MKGCIQVEKLTIPCRLNVLKLVYLLNKIGAQVGKQSETSDKKHHKRI